MAISLYTNDNAVAAAMINAATSIGTGSLSMATYDYRENGVNKRTVVLIQKTVGGPSVVNVLDMSDLNAAVLLMNSDPGGVPTYELVNDGSHVPGPKPTTPPPDDLPPELEEDPLPPLAVGP